MCKHSIFLLEEGKVWKLSNLVNLLSQIFKAFQIFTGIFNFWTNGGKIILIGLMLKFSNNSAACQFSCMQNGKYLALIYFSLVPYYKKGVYTWYIPCYFIICYVFMWWIGHMVYPKHTVRLINFLPYSNGSIMKCLK